MSEPPFDALVFFRATGDLAYKKILPALQAMISRGLPRRRTICRYCRLIPWI